MPSGGPPVFRRVAIVGCGLIGGSLALAIRRRWPHSEGVGGDRPPGLAGAAPPGGLTAGGDDLAYAADANLIVLAAPVRQNVEVLGRLAAAITGETLVTDVGSTKARTVEAARALPSRLRFIGGHPLAGAALGGIEAAR